MQFCDIQQVSQIASHIVTCCFFFVVFVFPSTLPVLIWLLWDAFVKFFLSFASGVEKTLTVQAFNVCLLWHRSPFCVLGTFEIVIPKVIYLISCHIAFNSLQYCVWDVNNYVSSGPYFWRLCAFSQKINQIWTKYPMDLVRDVPRNSKITVSLQ